MPQLKVLEDTVFKQSPVQSALLPENEKVSVKAGTAFTLHSFMPGQGNHVRVALSDTQLKGRNTWVAFRKHVEIVQDDGTKSVGPYKLGDKLPDEVNIAVPWFSQRDNVYRPFGTCNVTCVAMAAYFYGRRPSRPNIQLEDEMFKLVEARGWDRHVHVHLARVFREYKIQDTFKDNATWEEVKVHLANGNPVIYSGQLTGSGHIILLRGYSDSKKGFWVNDPYGEYFSWGYKDKSGENLLYSYNLLRSKSMMGRDQPWAHFPSLTKVGG